MNTRDLKNSQASNEWYTPAKYIEAARLVMGSIELDPASSAIANETVKATRFYTEEQNGLLFPWIAQTLWLNAPGAKHGSGQARWQRQLVTEYKAGRVKEAIMCVFNASGTETGWFQSLLGKYPICLTNHRIKFTPPAGKYEDNSNNQPVHGNAFVYFGSNVERFTEVFSEFGTVIPAWKVQVAPNAPTGRANAPQSVFGDIRDQFTLSGEMVASTLRYALHARTRELDAALAKIAILELRIKYHEQDPLRLAYDKLEATGASLVFVGEIKAGDTPRIREAGDLLHVLEALASRWALFETRVIALNAEEAA